VGSRGSVQELVVCCCCVECNELVGQLTIYFWRMNSQYVII